MVLIGYAKKHPAYSLKKQVLALKEAGCELIFQEKCTHDNSELLKALEVYEIGQDVFMTLLHSENDFIKQQFLAFLELQRYNKGRGRPKKSILRTEDIALKLCQKNLSNQDICEILGISKRTLSRIKREQEVSDSSVDAFSDPQTQFLG